MGVILQAFYWDCPVSESCEHKWWVEIKKRIPALQQAGFTALWLPPVSKAASWKSMGYDPYDYYDLGEFDQKGGVPTWFGSKAELLDLVQTRTCPRDASLCRYGFQPQQRWGCPGRKSDR